VGNKTWKNQGERRGAAIKKDVKKESLRPSPSAVKNTERPQKTGKKNSKKEDRDGK